MSMVELKDVVLLKSVNISPKSTYDFLKNIFGQVVKFSLDFQPTYYRNILDGHLNLNKNLDSF